MTTAEATLLRREALERSHDGPIPAHLLDERSDADLMAGHHRGMIRYCQSRLRDLRAALPGVEAMPDAAMREIWLRSTRENIADSEATLAHHEAQLVDLALQVAAE